MGDTKEAMGAGSSVQRRLFLSHSSKDKADVQRLRVALADRGIGAWEDVLELRLGGGLDALRDAIVAADGLVLLLTPASIGSDWVQREVAWAREAQALSPDYVILPILRGLERGALKLLNDLGIVRYKLHRFDEARQALTASLALLRPFGYAAEPWKPWAALEAVERDANEPEAALEARREALRTYRAYRADGGEPMDGGTRFIVAFGQTLRASGSDAARALLARLTKVGDELAPTLRALQAFAAGSRDPALADDPAHDPTAAVELALLLETLRGRHRGRGS